MALLGKLGIVQVKFLTIPSVLLMWVLGNWFGRGRISLAARRVLNQNRLPTCLECGYNLTGNTSGICPECGCGYQNADEDIGGGDERGKPLAGG